MAAGILGVALSCAVLLCGAGPVAVKNLLPQGTMQGDLDAGGHHIMNAASVEVNWQTIDATMVNTSGIDGNPAFALVPGNNYVIDQVTNGPFELALPDPTTEAASAEIHLRNANGSGSVPYVFVCDSAFGGGYCSLWWQSSEADLRFGTTVSAGGDQFYGDMVLQIGIDSVPQNMWVANEATASGRVIAPSGTSLTVIGNGYAFSQPSGTNAGLVPFTDGSNGSTLRQIQATDINPLEGIPYLIGRSGTSGNAAVLSAATSRTLLGIYEGSFSGTGSATTTFTVTIGSTLGNSGYKVEVTPTSAVAAAPFYVNNKTTTTFDVVYLSAVTGSEKFDWVVTP